jgi:membrane-bound metal-dependent hydrolase YbcI (DUF457 family)
VDPFTHALASLTLARAIQIHLPRRGYAMLLLAGVAPDLDWLSYLFGPAVYLRLHQSLLHSFVGAAIVVCSLGIVFVALDRRLLRRMNMTDVAPLGLVPAAAVCALGVALHLVLDAATDIGFQPLWPFRVHWIALDWLPRFEIWVVLILAVALLVPELIHMVSEEIGERLRPRRGITAGAIGLAVLLLYMSARGVLHNRANALLDSREYQGFAPLAVGAFPTTSPLTWRGVVSTEFAMDEVDVPFMPGEVFDPERAVPHAKPDEAAVLDLASSASAARAFLAFARFPLASVDVTDIGARVRFRDLRFEYNDKSLDNLAVEVVVTSNGQIVTQTVYYNAAGHNE